MLLKCWRTYYFYVDYATLNYTEFKVTIGIRCSLFFVICHLLRHWCRFGRNVVASFGHLSTLELLLSVRNKLKFIVKNIKFFKQNKIHSCFHHENMNKMMSVLCKMHKQCILHAGIKIRENAWICTGIREIKSIFTHLFYYN